MNLKNKKILTFFAHPDDEVLGAGGTIAKASSLGSEVFVVIPATGINARRNKEDIPTRTMALHKLQSDCHKALKLLGVKNKNIFIGEFEDNEMDSVTNLTVIHFLEAHIEKIKPDIILTHHYRCTNIDHRICYESVIVAARPSITNHITILSAEIPSSTGYLRPTNFDPSLYIELTEAQTDLKIKAMERYEGESRKDPHPRSSEVLKAVAKVRGSEAGYYWAEAFMCIRSFIGTQKYPDEVKQI